MEDYEQDSTKEITHTGKLIFYNYYEVSVMQQENNIKQKEHGKSSLFNKKNVLFMVLFIVIAVMTVFAVMSQSQEFSISSFLDYVEGSSFGWLFAALLSMLGFIFFEAIALAILCKAFGNKQSLGRTYIYSASDIYFSAITPSATGGQPASAFFMIKNGMNSMMVTALLVANLCMYTLSIILIGIVCFIFRWEYFMQYNLFSQLLIGFGFVSQVLMLIFFYLLLKKDRLLHRICNVVLRLLCKMRLLKKREEKQKKLDAYMEKYRQHSKIITQHRKSMGFCLLFNLLQRASQIAVTMFVYCAASGAGIVKSIELWFMQGYVTLGSNSIPIPGAMGVSDYLMIDGFQCLMTEQAAVNLELLSRSFSFYSCVIICGISTLAYYLIIRKRGKKK